MIEESAIVTGLDGDLAMIQMLRQGTCSQCELNSGCGTGAIGRMLGHRSKLLTIKNNYNLKPGDSVLLGMPDKAYMKASLLIYGLPLVGLIAGSLLAQALFGNSETITILFAIAGFASASLYSTVILNNRLSHQCNPVILQVYGELKH